MLTRVLKETQLINDIKTAKAIYPTQNKFSGDKYILINDNHVSENTGMCQIRFLNALGSQRPSPFEFQIHNTKGSYWPRFQLFQERETALTEQDTSSSAEILLTVFKCTRMLHVFFIDQDCAQLNLESCSPEGHSSFNEDIHRELQKYKHNSHSSKSVNHF